MPYKLSIGRMANALLVLVLTVFILIWAKSVLLPLAFSVFFAFMLMPLCNWIERWISARSWAIIIAFLIALLPVLAVLGLFSYEFTVVIDDLGAIGSKLKSGLTNLLHWLGDYIPAVREQEEVWIDQSFSSMLERGLGFVQVGLSSSGLFLASLVLTVLFTFFILLYRTAFQQFMLAQFSPGLRKEASKVMQSVQELTRRYLNGMLIIVLILGVLNSLGLWLIGIDYPVFWGVLAAFLAIIPYIGTTIGGTLPFLYALATTDFWWQPIAVILLYSGIQSLEGNVITPKVVGNSVDINPFAAILGLLIGGLIWGVPGLILALPVVAGLKIAMEHIDRLMPVAELLNRDLYKRQEVFMEKYDNERYRLMGYFKQKADRKRKAKGD